MIERIRYGGVNNPYNYSEFVCDTVVDLTDLPTTVSVDKYKKFDTCSIGSKATVISNKTTYILNSNNQWIMLNDYKTSGGSIVVDETLTESGQAADSKVVGDKFLLLENWKTTQNDYINNINIKISSIESNSVGQKTAEGGEIFNIGTAATGSYSHAEGFYTIASGSYQHVQGKFNVEDSDSKYAFIVGNGTDENNRSNAIAIDWDGLFYLNNSDAGIDLSEISGNVTKLINDSSRHVHTNMQALMEITDADITALHRTFPQKIYEIEQSLSDYATKEEVTQARVDANGTTYSTLKERLDSTDENVESVSTELKSDLVDVLQKSPNLIDQGKCLVNKTWGGINNSDLLDDTLSVDADKYVLTNVIYCSPGERYTVNTLGYLTNFYGAYKTNNGYKYNLNLSKTFTEKTFTIPDGCRAFRFRFTIKSVDDESWKTKIMLVKGDTLPTEFMPFGKKALNLNLEIPQLANYAKKEDVSAPTIIKEKNEDVWLSGRDRAICVITFDGMCADEYSANTILPYLRDNDIPFTVFTAGSTDNTTIARYKKVKEYGGEVQLYNSQPASTYKGTDNYIEQYRQFKNAYDSMISMGCGIPKFVAYSGGMYTPITEDIAKQFGMKWARTTKSSYESLSTFNDCLYNVCSYSMNDSNYVSYSPFPDSDLQYKMIRIFTIHSLISETITDTSYNISWEHLKEFFDSNIAKRDTGKLEFLNFSQLYERVLFPKCDNIGQHLIKYDSIDDKQHEYVYTENGWVDITNKLN